LVGFIIFRLKQKEVHILAETINSIDKTHSTIVQWLVEEHEP